MWRKTSSTPIGLKSHPIVAPEAVEAARHRRAEDEAGLLVLVALEWAHHPDPVAHLLQQTQGQALVDRIVLRHEDGQAPVGPGRRTQDYIATWNTVFGA